MNDRTQAKLGPTKFKDLEFHPIANLFPLIEGEEFEKLVRSIRESGLQYPIILWEGKILDGRNRHRAVWRIVQEDGKMPPISSGVPVYSEYEEFQQFRKKSEGWKRLEITHDMALDYVLSTNLRRRHLTTDQRAAIAVEIANMRQGERTDLPSNEGKLKLSQPAAAGLMGVSVSSVERAAKRRREDPEGHEAAKARKKVSKPKPEPSSVPKPTSVPSFPNEIRTKATIIIKLISELSELDPDFNKALDLIEDQIRLSRAENQGNIEPEPEPNQATLKVDELNKIAAIKWLMLIAPGLGLADSKQIVEEAMGKANKLSEKEVAA
jgi:ribosomal protein L7/L12